MNDLPLLPCLGGTKHYVKRMGSRGRLHVQVLIQDLQEKFKAANNLVLATQVMNSFEE